MGIEPTPYALKGHRLNQFVYGTIKIRLIGEIRTHVILLIPNQAGSAICPSNQLLSKDVPAGFEPTMYESKSYVLPITPKDNVMIHGS